MLGAGADTARAYTAGQVARVLGIAETTLRSWHRRYGVAPQASRPGAYRRYTAEDIGRLQHMCDLIRSGMLASDAAKVISGQSSSDRLRTVLAQLLDAARGLDNRACRALVGEALQAFGVVTAWEQVCRPALLDVEEQQLVRADGESCIPREHVLSWGIASALHQVAPPPAGEPAVLLACTDGELHTLPLEVLAAALAERHVPARVLGGGVPTSSLLEAVRSASPDVVVLWAHRPETASPEALRALRRLPVRRMTAGPGWPARRRGRTEHVDSLLGALTALVGDEP